MIIKILPPAMTLDQFRRKEAIENTMQDSARDIAQDIAAESDDTISGETGKGETFGVDHKLESSLRQERKTNKATSEEGRDKGENYFVEGHGQKNDDDDDDTASSVSIPGESTSDVVDVAVDVDPRLDVALPAALPVALAQRKPWWRSAELWKRLTALCFLWVTSTATFWSVNLSASDLFPGNRFLNLVILGVMHVPSLLLGLVFGRFCTRRLTLTFFFLGGCVCFLASFLAQLVGGLTPEDDEIFWLTIVGEEGGLGW